MKTQLHAPNDSMIQILFFHFLFFALLKNKERNYDVCGSNSILSNQQRQQAHVHVSCFTESRAKSWVLHVNSHISL